MIEMLLFPMIFLLMGFRHGFDSDHVAAIADIVGAESGGSSGRSVRLGIMYALGQGMIVLVVGILAVFAGSRLPERFLEGMEMLVGASLLVLGTAILLSIVRQKKEYQYVSRSAMVYGWLRKWTGRKVKNDPKLQQVGIAGAFVIGIGNPEIHVAAVFIDNMIDKKMVGDFVMRSLNMDTAQETFREMVSAKSIFDFIKDNALSIGEVEVIKDWNGLMMAIFSGDTVICLTTGPKQLVAAREGGKLERLQNQAPRCHSWS